MKTFSSFLNEASKVKKQLQEAPLVLQKGKFWVDGMKSPEVGYYDPSYRWNGFYAPLFDEKTAWKIVSSLPGVSADIKHGVLWVQPDGEDGDPSESEIKTYQTVDGHKDLYFIGDSWTWVKK